MCVCVSECVPSFSVLAAATFSPDTRETPDLLNWLLQKLSPLDRCLLSSNGGTKIILGQYMGI